MKIIGLVFLGLLVYGGVRFGPDLLAFYRAGLLDFSPVEMREYQGTSRDNLKAIRTALMLYHDSEGVFPGKAWMDEVRKRIQTKDMPQSEALKKLVNPLLRPTAPNAFGYSLNSEVCGKYVDDLPEKDKTILVFDSQSTKWDAVGTPSKDKASPPRPGGNLAILVNGEIIELK